MKRIVFNMLISRSQRLMIYLLGIHTIILIILTILFKNSYWVIAPAILIISSFIYYLHRYQGLKSAFSIIRISRDSEQNWSLYSALGEQYSELELRNSVVTCQQLILYFKGQRFWQYYSLLIMADSVDATQFRHLRLYCRSPKTFQQ